MKGWDNMREKLWLSELIEQRKIEVNSGSIIVAPPGSGKTYYISHSLRERYEGRALILASTTSLKEAYLADEHNFSPRYDGSGRTEVKTYHQLGEELKFTGYEDVVDEYDVVFCDEVHSLFQYYNYTATSPHGLGKVIERLFITPRDEDIFSFTATLKPLVEFEESHNIQIFDEESYISLKKERDIMRYLDDQVVEFTDEKDLSTHLDSIKDAVHKGRKGVYFTERISKLSQVSRKLDEKGFKPITIWSVNNPDHKMNDEQLRVREQLLKEGTIAAPYNFVFINESMREGWNLIDPDVELVIIDSVDEVNSIQARGRVRKDIIFLYQRVKDERTIEEVVFGKLASTGLLSNILNNPLDADGKKDLEDKLDVEHRGNRASWRLIKRSLEAHGYAVEDKRRQVDGKRKTFSVVKGAD